MAMLTRCVDCGQLLDLDEQEATDEAQCSLCRDAADVEVDDDDPDALPGDDRPPLRAPAGWGPPPPADRGR